MLSSALAAAPPPPSEGGDSFTLSPALLIPVAIVIIAIAVFGALKRQK